MLVLVAIVAVTMSACASDEPEQLSFDTPGQAAIALITALSRDDDTALRHLLGPDTDSLISSGDDVADRNLRKEFIARYRARHEWAAGGPNDLVLQVGENLWPLPIPLVREQGRWRFDGAAGASELLSRRIGANELHTIDVMRGFVVAQTEYASSHDGAYARQLRSDPGQRNGLYWDTKPGEPPSPAGPLLASAAAEGYVKEGSERTPYHGYLFRSLHSPGGFALIAWPASYGESGVMTFVVSQDGVVWQKDLGAETPQLAVQIREYNPDAEWIPIPPEDTSHFSTR